MAIVEIKIRNSIHQIACNDGQEHELGALADKLTARVNKLAESAAKANDTLLLIMAALTAEEEIKELHKLKSSITASPAPAASTAAKDDAAIDLAVAEALDAVSDYVETLVNKLQS